jgi:hypothetical protein
VEAKLVHCKVCTQFTLTFVEYRRGSFLDRVYTENDRVYTGNEQSVHGEYRVYTGNAGVYTGNDRILVF